MYIRVNIMEYHKGMKLYNNNQSYTFLASSPYHKNESANIITKIQQAAYKTNIKSPDSSKNSRNTCFIRIPTFIDPDYCRKLCLDNIDNMHYDNLYSIFFYSVAIGTNLLQNTSYINHYISAFIIDPHQLANLSTPHTNALCFPIGLIRDKYDPYQIVNEDGSAIPLSNSYIYQHGQCFIDKLDYNIGEMINLDATPDGIECFNVTRVPGGTIAISPYKGTGELFIL